MHIGKVLDTIEDRDRKIEKFQDVLDTLRSSSDKKKMLWKDAYENALIDRANAHMLFIDGLLAMGSDKKMMSHMSMGSLMVKYLERMSKANDQILRLAEVVAKSIEDEAEIDIEDVFSKISS